MNFDKNIVYGNQGVAKGKKWPFFEKIELFCQQRAIHWLSADNTESYPSMAPTGAPRLKGTKKALSRWFFDRAFSTKKSEIVLNQNADAVIGDLMQVGVVGDGAVGQKVAVGDCSPLVFKANIESLGV